jgi:opacity protein-like surface antigen
MMEPRALMNKLKTPPATAIAAVFLLAGSAGWSQPAVTNADENFPTVKLEPTAPVPKNRIGIAYQMGLNMTVDFRRLGGLALSDPGPAIGTAVNRTYDNGYNRVDVSGNAGGLTWHWGYENQNSAQGDNLALQSYSTPANGLSKNREGDPQHGIEVFFQRELRRGKHWRLGAEAAFGYTAISIRDDRTLKATAYRTNDTYGLGGVIPPLAPYHGTMEGPGPLIASEPSSRSVDVLARSATVTGEREINSDVFMIRLGPYLEVPLMEKLSLFGNAGLNLAVSHTEFKFRETVTISDPINDINLVSSRRHGSGSQTDFLVGAYAGGGFEYALTERLTFIAGARYQAAGRSLTQKGGRQALLDLGSSIVLSFGATYSF